MLKQAPPLLDCPNGQPGVTAQSRFPFAFWGFGDSAGAGI